ncbi:ribosome maturation factor RimM [Nordella sp. HKS 07]|uniref:ribosome maturation factor RimM n=1 Tax=Nordella sp. HKS 07 TaxID=2712222 RepID=UPI0013E15EEE|nr:ribosome maturation factor RimM [Nordella sp. HKS 07]QIG47613.1 ribosome maturation factor RimM [Nordella sp. HKS 07]
MVAPGAKVLAGVITAAHGIKGEVKLRSFTGDPEAIASYGPLITARGESLEIEKLRAQKEGFIAVLKGVRDRNRAETLKGAELFLERAQLPEPEGDEVYLADLIGVTAVSASGEKFGTVIAVPNYGAGDLLEIRRDGVKETVLVPFAEDYVPRIDLEKAELTLDLPETYLDDGVPDDQ